MSDDIINALRWCFLGLLYAMPALFLIAGCVTIWRDNVKK
jgi:hypothetical protein